MSDKVITPLTPEEKKFLKEVGPLVAEMLGKMVLCETREQVSEIGEIYVEKFQGMGEEVPEDFLDAILPFNEEED